MTSTTRTRGSAGSTRRVLGDRDAGLYLAAVVVSGLGSSAMWLVAGIWVKDLTGSDALAALCACALWAPLLAGPWLGTLADRHRRRPLLIATDLGLAALLLTLFTVDTPGDLWVLYTVLLLYGTAGVVHDAAESALVATAVGPSLLGDFNGLRMTANESMKLVAPLAGAGLYAVYGAATVALLDAVTFVAAAGLYASVRAREGEPVRTGAGRHGRWLRSSASAPVVDTDTDTVTGTGTHTGTDTGTGTGTGDDQRPRAGRRARTAEGARHLLTDKRLRPLVLAGGTTMLLSGINGALIHAVVEPLGHSPAYAGLLYLAQGAGSITVGLATGPLLRRLGGLPFAAYGIALTGSAVALRAIPNDTVALACSAAIGIGLPCVLTAALTAVQRAAPPELLGRTTATAHTLLFAPTAVGTAIGAAVVQPVDLRVLSAAVGGAHLLTAAWLLRHR
ncbi:MFS transporter [Streptomyces sp. TG1A-60]|uniref:MFS transporter n=1 Tax=Streptomyces sp. TG1A-60 TaxID=3129111 RepID=UPI0030D0B85B